eukprot:12169621-Heterocapsa_arctica.AAC.1
MTQLFALRPRHICHEGTQPVDLLRDGPVIVLRVRSHLLPFHQYSAVVDLEDRLLGSTGIVPCRTCDTALLLASSPQIGR